MQVATTFLVLDQDFEASFERFERCFELESSERGLSWGRVERIQVFRRGMRFFPSNIRYF